MATSTLVPVLRSYPTRFGIMASPRFVLLEKSKTRTRRRHMDVEMAVSEFVAAHVGNLSSHTITGYKYGFRHMLEVIDPTTPVDAVSRANIRRLRRWLAGRDDMAPASKNTVLRAVRRLFNWLEDEWEVERSPARGIRLFNEDVEAVRAIEMSDYRAMVRVARAERGYRDVAIMSFMLATGCRVSGLTTLTMDRLDLPNLRARVIEKGHKSRWVFFPVEVGDNIRHYNRPRNGGPEVFLSVRGRQLAKNGVYQMLQKWARLAGVDSRPFNPHSFRHRFAIEYLKNGGDLSSLCELMGHSHIGITHRYYARWSRSMLQGQHAKFNPLSGGDY